MPRKKTARPTGMSAKSTIAVSLAAHAIEKNTAKKAPRMYMAAYGTSKKWSSNCSRK
jgi:hypothetical protein